MKHIIKSIQYKGLSAVDWYDMDIIPASASLDISSSDTSNGRVESYAVNAKIRRKSRPGEASLDQELILRISYDNDSVIKLGTNELPVRLSVRTTDISSISTTWKTRPGLLK